MTITMIFDTGNEIVIEQDMPNVGDGMTHEGKRCGRS
jgi:hypothetical protein